MFPDLTRDDVFRIETRRLWLRWPAARDAEAVAVLAGERAVAEASLRIPYPLPRHLVATFLLRARRDNAAGDALTLAITRRAAPGSLIGIVGIGGGSEAPDLAFWLGRPWSGGGLMSEAVAALVHAYFAYARGERLTAQARADDPAARRVLEKAGFIATGQAVRFVPPRGRDLETTDFGLDRNRWAAVAGSAEERGIVDMAEASA